MGEVPAMSCANLTCFMVASHLQLYYLQVNSTDFRPGGQNGTTLGLYSSALQHALCSACACVSLCCSGSMEASVVGQAKP